MLTSCATRLLNALATFRGNSAENALVSAVLIEAQRWMRAREGKIPRLVSLRDIERCIEAFLWFEASWSLLSPLMDISCHIALGHFRCYVPTQQQSRS